MIFLLEMIKFEDEHLIVCVKPAGTAVQTRKNGEKDLESILKNYLFEKNGFQKEPYLAVIHRLDQPVEGLLVFAKTPMAAKELNKQLNTFTFKKFYLAVATGSLNSDTASLTNYLVKNTETNSSYVVPKGTPNAKKAALHYEVKEKTDELMLIRIELFTGRHHQIRVQLAHAGAPLYGDRKYNANSALHPQKSSLALCAYSLSFLHPKTKRPCTFEITPENPIFHSFA